MNKIFSLGLLLTGVLAFTACSDDEVGQEYIRENTVRVVQSALTFTADGGKGGVKFTAPAGAKAYTNTEWATAEIVGNDSVVVTVGVNAKLGGRGAKLTIKCGNDSTNVSITQLGSSFKISGSKEFYLNDDATVLSLPYTSSGVMAEITASDNAAIPSTEYADGNVNITVSANETGSVRTSEVYFNIDNRVDTVRVIQITEKDLLNKQYILGGIDLDTYLQTQDAQQSMFLELGQLIKRSGKLYYYTRGTVQGTVMQIPLTFNSDDLTLTVEAGNAVGTFRQSTSLYRLMTGIVDYSAMNAFADVEAKWAYDHENLNIKSVLSGLFLNNGLSLIAPLSVTSEGTVAGEFQDLGRNSWFVASSREYVKNNLGITPDFNSFNGFLGLAALSGQNFAGWYTILIGSAIEEYNPNEAKEAQLSAVKAKLARKAAKLPILGKPLFPVVR
jgi:hypothetical protein